MSDFIVCGWFTPDYAHWAHRLRTNLDKLDLPHDFVLCRPREGSWAKATLRKAEHVLAAMQRHPGKAIVFLDVDCEVMDRDRLIALADIPGDVAFYLRTKFRRAGGARLDTRSGTMLFKATPGAKAFAEKWAELSRAAPPYCVDQNSLTVTIGKVPDCLVNFFDKRYCASPSDQFQDPWILHACASAALKKPSSAAMLAGRALHVLRQGVGRRLATVFSLSIALPQEM